MTTCDKCGKKCPGARDWFSCPVCEWAKCAECYGRGDPCQDCLDNGAVDDDDWEQRFQQPKETET